MPFYDWNCPRCGVLRGYVPLSEWDINRWDGHRVCSCGSRADMVFGVPNYKPVNPYGFRVINLEQENFGTNREYREYLKRNGLSESEPGRRSTPPQVDIKEKIRNAIR